MSSDERNHKGRAKGKHTAKKRPTLVAMSMQTGYQIGKLEGKTA